MPINVSEETASSFSSNLNRSFGLFPTTCFDDSDTEESNYQSGKKIFDDVKLMMGSYSIAVERDAQHITDISWELIKADNEMMIGN